MRVVRASKIGMQSIDHKPQVVSCSKLNAKHFRYIPTLLTTTQARRERWLNVLVSTNLTRDHVGSEPQLWTRIGLEKQEG